MIYVTEHACERYAERILKWTLSTRPESRKKTLERVRDIILADVAEIVKPGHKEQYHLPMGDAVFVIKEGRVVTVKIRDEMGYGRIRR